MRLAASVSTASRLAVQQRSCLSLSRSLSQPPAALLHHSAAAQPPTSAYSHKWYQLADRRSPPSPQPDPTGAPSRRGPAVDSQGAQGAQGPQAGQARQQRRRMSGCHFHPHGHTEADNLVTRRVRQAVAATPDGSPIHSIALSNTHGVSMEILTAGASIWSLTMPDRDGTVDDIVLGLPNAGDYMTNSPFMGCVVGRTAGRIGGGLVDLDEKTEVKLTHCDGAEIGKNNLHGGPNGFSRQNWTAMDIDLEESMQPMDNSVILRLHSPHMDQGFPGAINTQVIYTLTHDNYVLLEYTAAVTDDSPEQRPVPFNLTNHTYFQLAGANSGPRSVEDHTLEMTAEKVLVVRKDGTFTGEQRDVTDTLHDFRKPRRLGDVIQELSKHQPEWPHGDAYMTGNNHKLADYESFETQFVGELCHPPSGRCISFVTSEPVVQTYFSTFLGGTPGKRGVTYEKYGGVCLEFQRFADCYAMKEKDGNKAAYNRRFRSCSSLAPGQYYIQRTAWHLHTK